MKVYIKKPGVMKKILMLFIFGIGFWTVALAQEDSAVTETNEASKQKFTRATFNSTRIINMQSVEIVSPGGLQLMISHHFGYAWNKDLAPKGSGKRFKQNMAHLFGFNAGIAHTYLSFDYSPTKWSNVGIAATGRAVFEGWAKFKILRQQTGAKNIPVTIAWYSMANIYTGLTEPDEFTNNRWSFMHQLLIARKFSNRFSLQLMPTLIHFNTVPYGINNSNLVWSIGMGAKYKATDKINITLEYARQLNMYENLVSKNGSILNYSPNLLSVGAEINTGGHQFQFFIGTTTDASNIDMLARNNSWIKDGHFAFGFTINRTMALKK
jgi:opacity protein-like surface antigen